MSPVLCLRMKSVFLIRVGGKRSKKYHHSFPLLQKDVLSDFEKKTRIIFSIESCSIQEGIS